MVGAANGAAATAADDKSSAGMNTARLLQEVQIGDDDAVTTAARSHQFSESLFDSVTPMEETTMAAQDQSSADMNSARLLQEALKRRGIVISDEIPDSRGLSRITTQGRSSPLSFIGVYRTKLED